MRSKGNRCQHSGNLGKAQYGDFLVEEVSLGMGGKAAPNIDDILKRSREARDLEFKACFDPTGAQDWCELTKDIVAMANTVGGYIIVGLTDACSGICVSGVLALDPSMITDKVFRYTGRQFSDFDIPPASREGHQLAVICVGSADTPMVFSKPGTYPVDEKNQKTAFSKGQVYFRHGAKSEPGDSDDLRKWLEREIGRARRSWLGNIRKVVSAPIGASVLVSSPGLLADGTADITEVRITDDPSAPVYGKLDPNVTHPFRGKELIEHVNKEIGDSTRISQHDLLCVRKIYDIESNGDFFYRPMYTSPRYSMKLAEWLVGQHRTNPQFFLEARERYRQQTEKD